ncbi:nucleotide sugar dehydrogenase [Gammaproteobacteria bacterium]|nr:nucleotide sugar dehydrogenase [Gammaproteobacteria bacterium]
MFHKITIIGAGYVGFSLAVLLSQEKEVTLFDIDTSKLQAIDNNKSPIRDRRIDEFLEQKALNLKTSYNLAEAIFDRDLIVLALPTNFIESSQFLDTSQIDLVISKIIKKNSSIPILIKSTVPQGFTKRLQAHYPNVPIIFSPEFLREGSALEDNLHPHRIIVGNTESLGSKIAELFASFALNEPEILLMDSDEAEAIKLFSNAYLATRVCFFNELDTFALANNLDSQSIINGVTSDPRIGSHYCNPSFGYGGYCLPKDTKQLESQFRDLPQVIFSSVIKSNILRKKYIATYIASLEKKVIGVYFLAMKKNSDNFKDSSIIGVLQSLKELNKNISILIYEPLVQVSSIFGCEVVTSLERFKQQSEIIITNRSDDALDDVKDKVFTRDIYNNN